MWKKILIIEDEKVLNDMYAMKFTNSWYEVESAYEWLDWITKIHSFKPDVVLLDIMMPWMNWFETLRVLKQQTSYDMKVVMFTNLNSEENKTQAYDTWADGYLVKADTTPQKAVDVINDLFKIESKREKFEHELSEENDKNIDIIPTLKEWINKFKLIDSSGKEIVIDINISL